jgi:ABC-type phosphate/phosphonate transport system ATPase subunit
MASYATAFLARQHETLRVEQVSASYGAAVHALREVSLAMPPGLCGILGALDAGKSTLLQYFKKTTNKNTRKLTGSSRAH